MKRLFQLLLVSSVLIVIPLNLCDDASKAEEVEVRASVSKIRLHYTYLDDSDINGNKIKGEAELSEETPWGSYPGREILQVDISAEIDFQGAETVTTQDVWLVLSVKISPYVARIFEHPEYGVEENPNYAEMERLATWFDAIEVRRQSVELGENNPTIVTFRDVDIDQILGRHGWDHEIKLKVILSPVDGDKNYSDNMAVRVIPVTIPY